MTFSDQLKELLQEFKYIKGQNLSIAKRVKALEEKKEEYKIPLITIAEVALLHRIAEYLGEAVKEPEPMLLTVVDESDPLEGIQDLPIIEKEDVVSEEVLEELDEVLNGD